MIKKVFLTAALALSCALAAAQDWGGRYIVEFMEGEQSEAKGDLYLVPLGPDRAEFYISVVRKDGAQIIYDTADGPVTLEGDRFIWHYPGPDFDYTLTIDLRPEANAGEPMENTVMVSESVGAGAPPYNIDLSPDGFYRRDLNYFVAPNGYMYHIAPDGQSCNLAFGGIYSGVVDLPLKVQGPFGRMFPVAGIEQDAFTASRNLTQVSIAGAEQRVAPGALSFTGVPYDWAAIGKPLFAYPDKSRTRFAVPGDTSLQRPENGSQWVVFKQNLAPCSPSGDSRADEERRLGRVDQDFGSTRGLFYNILSPAEEVKAMFKGYQAGEIEALIAPPDFVAFHTFPSFGRWKFPEREQDAKAAVVRKVAAMYGRTPMYSRRAAWLRDGSAELDIVEFEHKDHQAMVVFAWVGKDGDIYATAALTTEIESEFEDSGVWNVDDEGTYGIPDVVSIALDPDGYATIFLAKNSPESINCFALHQVGDKFEVIDFDQWYRFIDI